MSDLTQEELNAGISRRALATIRRNHSGRSTPTLEDHLAAQAESGILRPERIYVLDTYDHSLDIVNLDGWRFRIRDLHRTSKQLEQVELALDRPELQRLAEKIEELLRESPAPKAVKTK